MHGTAFQRKRLAPNITARDRSCSLISAFERRTAEMGHSFCSGPSLPDDLKTELAPPGVKIKRIPRSPGFTAERRLPTDDFTDIRNLHAIKDLLQEDPSSLIRTDSKRRKRITDLLAKPAHLSSKQVKQMLLSRRSLSPHPSVQSFPTPLAKDVAPRTTKDGKKYLQIATSQSMYGCGNPSVYQVNHRQAAPASDTPASHKLSGGDPPLGSLDNIDPYYLGITEEYPHLIIDEGEGRQSRGAGLGGHSESLLPAMPVLYSDGPQDIGTAAAADHLPKINDVGGLAERQTSPVSKARIYGPKVNRSPVRVATNKAHNRPLTLGVRPPAPLALPARSKAQTSKTPRNSLEDPKKEVQGSPNPYAGPRAPFIQSTVNSIADDAQSEASVGIISMAQSAEVVRAGYYNSGALKFPKPGPAPTGALPSLPEGLDSKTSLVHLPSIGNSTGHSLQNSPTKSLTRSPGKRNRYRPLDDAVDEDTARLLRMQTRSKPRHVSQLPATGVSPKSSVDEPCKLALTPDEIPQTQEKAEDTWRQIRAQSRKALKLRDLNRIRSQDDNGQPSSDSNGTTVAGAQSKDVQASTAKMRESYSSPAVLPGYQLEFTKAGASDKAAELGIKKSRPISQISPILVLAEQKPIQLDRASTCTPRNSQDRHGKRVSHKPSCSKPSTYLPSPPLPSLPSSDEDNTKRRTTHPNGPNRHSAAHSTKSGPSASTHRASFPHPSTHPIELSELEARLSARITELEKKNTMLLNAFVAVMNTSAGFAGSEQNSVALSYGSGSNGDMRLSGGSGGTGMRSSGTSGGYRTSGGELERVMEDYGAGDEAENGDVNRSGNGRKAELDGS